MSTNDAERGAEPAADPAAPGIICPECNHANRASARFCSKCGTDLSEQTVIVTPKRRDAPAASEPPIAASSTEADATVPSPLLSPEPSAPTPAGPFGATAPQGGSKAWIAIVVVALVVIAAAAWWFVGANRPGEPAAEPKPLPAPAPAASTAPAPSAVPITPAIPVAASAPAAEPAAAAASAPEPASPAPSPAPAAAPVTPPPVAATPEPASAATAAPVDTEAQRVRAEQAREKAAKAKAAREAKAKALQEQQAAEQEAARKRAEEARARAAAQAAPARPAPAAQTPRTAQDVCAGGNAITRAICESRECGKPEHAGEAYCKQVKAAEDRRSGAP